MTDEPQPRHPTSVAVWGVPSPLAAASRFTATVGVKCSAGCPLAGRPVVIRDETGRELGRGTLGAEPAAGTRALYAASVALAAPPEPGVHAWTAAFPAEAESPPAEATVRPQPATGAAAHLEAASAPGHEGASAPDAAPRPEAASAPRPEPAPGGGGGTAAGARAPTAARTGCGHVQLPHRRTARERGDRHRR